MRMTMKDRTQLEKKDSELVDFARTYLSDGFPNPERQGCPPDGALRSLALNPNLSGTSVTEHLASCSPCFVRYSELLVELRLQKATKEKSSWKRLATWPKTHPVLTGTLVACAAIIAIVAGILFSRVRQPNSPPNEVHNTPRRSPAVEQATVYSPFSIDLSKVSPIRGSQNPSTESLRVRVPKSPLSLTLILPLGSEERAYRVTLKDGTKTVWSKTVQAHLSNGQVLVQFEVDFTQLASGHYEFGVESPAGIRLVQPVSVEDSLPTGMGPRK
jgi:hypothetical protein